MAWVEFKGKVSVNTNTIRCLNVDESDVYILLGESKVVLSETLKEAKRMIAEAERAERRLMFQENKDEIVNAVAEAVFKRINDALHIEKPKTQSPLGLGKRSGQKNTP